MIQFKKMLSDAVIPTRAGPNEAGFDLTLVRYVEQVGVNAHMFDTGIAVTPPAGYYSLCGAPQQHCKTQCLCYQQRGRN